MAWARSGAFVASLFFGAVQTFSVALDYSLLSLLDVFGVSVERTSGWYDVLSLSIAQMAPVLYLLMVLMLVVRPTGLMGTRDLTMRDATVKAEVPPFEVAALRARFALGRQLALWARSPPCC